MPADPTPILDELNKTIEDLIVKVQALKAQAATYTDDHEKKLTTAVAKLKELLG